MINSPLQNSSQQNGKKYNSPESHKLLAILLSKDE